MIEINLDLLNRLIDALIEHGGDSGGAYYSCKEKVESRMRAIAVNSGLAYVFDGEHPMFIQKKDNPHLFPEETQNAR